MKKNRFLHSIIAIIIIPSLMTFLNFNNCSAFSSILTFLSIISGFSITALSIIATSNFSKELYTKESKTNNSQTLLHELLDLFKNSTLLFITTIIIILIYQFLTNVDYTLISFYKFEISVKVILKSIIWYLTIYSFVAFINLLLNFSKFIIKSVAKTKA